MLKPWDEHNRRLAAQVAPADWVNPHPKPRYDLLVVGGGPAGLVCAVGAAGLGAKVALVEKHLLGGDCLNVGCVPSKALLACAKEAAQALRAPEYGVATGLVHVDFRVVMERMRRLRADLSRHDSAARFRDLGIDVFLGEGQFIARGAFSVGGHALCFSRACIATGARAALPDIPGLEALPCYTNESVFSLTELPRRLAVIGAGPIGCELAQAFSRFGSEVTVLNAAAQVLPREEPEAAAVVANALARDGVRMYNGVTDLRVADGALHFAAEGGLHWIQADAVLLATGRAPNIEGLGLDAAGVAHSGQGIEVDDRLRTANPNIFAAGDVASRHQFTHAADALARIVIQNALFLGRAKASALMIPWCTYTEPELAHVGKTATALREEGVAFTSHTVRMSEVDRAVLEGQTEGFVTVHADGKGRILGASVVSAHAGDLIGEISLAMTHGITLGQVAKAIHPYPTQAEAFRKVGDVYNRTRLTPLARGVLKLLLRRFGS